MSNYFLEHYGVKGMRWGRRKTRRNDVPRLEGPSGYNSSAFKSEQQRSRAKDVKYTEVGGSSKGNGSKKRGYTDNPKDHNKQKTPKSESSKFDPKSTQESLKTGKKFTDDGAKLLKEKRNKENKINLKKDAKNMSDEDLKKIVTRLNMEEKYISAMERDGYGSSKGDLEKTLELVGNAVSYADTALSIYSTIQDIRSR